MPLAPMNMRQNPVAGNYPDMESVDIDLDAGEDTEATIDPKSGFIKIELPDGSVTISMGGVVPGTKSDDFEANLALEIESSALGSIGSELIRLIEEDDKSRDELLQQYTAGLELLGTKIETPRSNASDGSTAVEGQSTVRHPLLLEAIVRFQANARGELLPSNGPVKARNDGMETLQADYHANEFERDFNHYLTVTASEYYPDTERMFFDLGFGGTAFKKVYYCPIRRRPVSEFVPLRDIIISSAETSAWSAQRVTHVIKMPPSTLKRMQLLGIYRDIAMTIPQPPKKNVVEEKIESMQGVVPNISNQMETEVRDIYECYCELDLPGFEHEEKGEKTGLRLPYRVTLDKSSREILEIRRWWKPEDQSYLRKQVFVDYIFVPGFGFYGLGYLHLLGNTTMTLTAGTRLCIDNGMFANFPGFLYAKGAGRQNTNEFRVPPGGGLPIDTAGLPIQNVVMNLPYRGVDSSFLNLLQMVEEGGQRLGSTVEVNVGEGNSEAPVGTTIAMIEQAQKVISSVHKRMHASQAREFQLLKELFKESPESFWENNKYPAFPWTPDALLAALDNVSIVPVADPNTPSHSARIQKAMMIKQLQSANPQLYDAKSVDMRVLTMMGIEDASSLFAPPAPPSGPDANTVMAQAKMMDAQARQAEVTIKAFDAKADDDNRVAERESKERIAMLQMARELTVHPEGAQEAESFLGPKIKELVQNPSV